MPTHDNLQGLGQVLAIAHRIPAVMVGLTPFHPSAQLRLACMTNFSLSTILTACS
ncbi:hypothetical protein H6F89_13215 [Cyanobacteria bacterium FACHB-63]|nr:hypothetical protein [Cyanobacteria bacterium FACHB-63]